MAPVFAETDNRTQLLAMHVDLLQLHDSICFCDKGRCTALLALYLTLLADRSLGVLLLQQATSEQRKKKG
jgi:hypothetical protein